MYRLILMRRTKRGLSILNALNYYSKSYLGLNELLISRPRCILELFKYVLKRDEDVALKLTVVLIRNYLIPNTKPRDLIILVNAIKQNNPHEVKEALEKYQTPLLEKPLKMRY